MSLPEATDEVSFVFWELPPSLNGLYRPMKGRLVLSDTGRRWKNKFVTSRGGLTAMQLAAFCGDMEMTYEVDIWAYLPEVDLFNTGYGRDGRVKYAFKSFDISNLIKLTEDAAAKLLGVDDRNNWDVSSHKRPTEMKAHLVVHVRPSLLLPDPRDPR